MENDRGDDRFWTNCGVCDGNGWQVFQEPCYVPPGYDPCMREKGHDGPCALPLAKKD